MNNKKGTSTGKNRYKKGTSGGTSILILFINTLHKYFKRHIKRKFLMFAFKNFLFFIFFMKKLIMKNVLKTQRFRAAGMKIQTTVTGVVAGDFVQLRGLVSFPFSRSFYKLNE